MKKSLSIAAVMLFTAAGMQAVTSSSVPMGNSGDLQTFALTGQLFQFGQPVVINAQPNAGGKLGPNGTICTLSIPGQRGNYSFNYPAPCTPANTFNIPLP